VRYLPDDHTGNLADQPAIRISGAELADLKNPAWPDRLGIRGQYPVRGLPGVADAIMAMSRTEPARAIYAKTGVLRRRGRPDVWLRFGGPALFPTGWTAPDGSRPVTDESARAELHPDYEAIPVLRELSFSLPSTDDQAAGDLAALFSATEVYPETEELPVLILAELFWAPASPDLGRISALDTGDSGEAGKTSFTDATVVAAQSATHQAGPGVEAIVFNCRNKGTALGLDQAMHPARGCVVSADDILTKHMSRADQGKALGKLDSITDSVATGTGAVRGGHRAGRSVFSMNRAPTGCLLVSAEDIPFEDRLVSLMGRMAGVTITNPSDYDQWSKALRVVQDGSREIGRAHSRYICDLLAAKAGISGVAGAALEKYRPDVTRWHRQHGGHKRTVETYARLAAGWVMGAEHEARITGTGAAERIAYGLTRLEIAFKAQAIRCGKARGARPATDTAELFVRMTHKVLSASPATIYVADAELLPGGLYQPPQGLDPSVWPSLGWRSREISTSGGGRETVWDHPAGAPAGAVIVHDPSAPGRPPRYPVRLLVDTAGLDMLTEAAAQRALSGPVPLTLSDGLVLREKLAGAGVLDRADAEKQNPVWAETANKRRYVLDLALILDGTLGHPEPGPEPCDDPDSDPDGDQGQAAGTGGPAEIPVEDPPPLPDDGGWGPGTEGAAAWTGAKPASLSQPARYRQPAPAARTAAALPGPCDVPRCGDPGERYSEGIYCGRHAKHMVLPAELAARATPPAPAAAYPAETQIRQVLTDFEAPPPPEAPPVEDGPPGARPARGPARDEMPRAERLGYFSRAVRKHFPDAADRDVSAGLDIFEHMRPLGGLRFEGSPGQVGILAFHKLQAQHGATPELDRADTAPIVAGLKVCWAYSVASAAGLDPAAPWVSSTDVNAQYLSAAGMSELGTGLPERVTDVRPEHLELPGYAWLDTAGLPAPFTVIQPGEVVPMPLAKLAVQWAREGRCPEPVISEALVWTEHRRWLGPLSKLLRLGRAALLDRTDLPGMLALDAIKQTYQTMYGGMVRSETYNRTSTLRPDWGDMIKGLSVANMWRGLAKASPAPFLVADPDAAYFAMAEEGRTPGGLVYSTQPGKWKLQRVCPLTDEIRSAVTADDWYEARKLIIAGTKAHAASREENGK